MQSVTAALIVLVTVVSLVLPQESPVAVDPLNTSGCTQQQQIAFLSTLQNAAVCAPSIAIVFGLYPSDVVTLGQALINACTEECGEIYAGFLEDVCHDRFSTDSLKIACTPTGGSAAVGEFCRFALADSIDISNINALQSCYDYTAEVPCPEDCRSAIHFLKIQIGCCYQHIYNNTDYFDHLQFLYWIFYPR